MVKNAAQFSKSLFNIADYVQMKYNNKVGDAIRNLKHPTFIYLEDPEERFVLDKDGNKVYQPPDEIKVFMWKKQWEKISSHETDYLKYQKTAYPLVLEQCSPALLAQLEGSKGFKKVNTDQDVAELLRMVRSTSYRHNQNTDKTYAIIQ